jgi:hypothetical protein
MAEMLDPAPADAPAPRRGRPVLRFLRKVLRNWRERHRHPFNFAIHLIGIPLAVAGVVLLFFTDWYWGVGAFVLGYLLQWIGHLVEGNDLGEWAGVKRLLGLPYVGISPRWRQGVPVSDASQKRSDWDASQKRR